MAENKFPNTINQNWFVPQYVFVVQNSRTLKSPINLENSIVSRILLVRKMLIFSGDFGLFTYQIMNQPFENKNMENYDNRRVSTFVSSCLKLFPSDFNPIRSDFKGKTAQILEARWNFSSILLVHHLIKLYENSFDRECYWMYPFTFSFLSGKKEGEFELWCRQGFQTFCLNLKISSLMK